MKQKSFPGWSTPQCWTAVLYCTKMLNDSRSSAPSIRKRLLARIAEGKVIQIGGKGGPYRLATKPKSKPRRVRKIT